MGEGIRVENLRETQRTLRDVSREFPRELRLIFNKAGEVVVKTAKPTIPVRSGRLAGSLKSASTQREGRVKMGTPKRVPYAGWIEFGGTIIHEGPSHRHGHGPQGVKRRVSSRRGSKTVVLGARHLIRRPFVKGGRYLFPAFEKSEPRVSRVAADGVEKLLRKAGLL